MDNPPELQPLPSIRELNGIYQKILPHTRITPIFETESLSQITGGRVLVKAESLQRTGAFKFRGALFRLMSLNETQKKQGVAAYSSGNFARGLAAAGKLLQIGVHLVMPADAPKNKIKNARKQGAQVTLCNDFSPSREEAAGAMAAKLARDNDHVLLHPFDDPMIIAGQASVAVELHEQLEEEHLPCNNLLCPVGGGSLVAGCSLVFDRRKTSTQVYAIEAEGFAGMNLSLMTGKVQRVSGRNLSHCDALQALSPGQANFEVVMQTGVKGLQVSENYVLEAIKLAFDEMKLVLEPSGAIGLAAIMQYPHFFRKQTTVVIATGGNVDQELFSELLRK